MVKIRYIGKKTWCVDNVAGTGKIFNGHGDVQTFTEDQAKKLLAYPDSWEEADKDTSADASTSEYAKHSKRELQELCDDRGIEYMSRAGKQALIDLLDDYDRRAPQAVIPEPEQEPAETPQEMPAVESGAPDPTPDVAAPDADAVPIQADEQPADVTE